MKIILKDEKIQKFIQEKVDSIKINNLENKLFSEIDLIREVEKEKSNFIDNKFGFISNASYKTLDAINLINKNEIDKKAMIFFDKTVIETLEQSMAVKEFKRFLKINPNKKLKIRDFILILNDKEIISFMYDKKEISEDEIIHLLENIKNDNFLDSKKCSFKEKTKVIKFLKEIIE